MKRWAMITLIAVAVMMSGVANGKIVTFEGQEYDFNRPENEICAYEAKRADKEMDVVYDMIMDAYGEHDKDKWENSDELLDAIRYLKASQRAWINYREAEISCEVNLLYFGGVPKSTAFNKKWTELTIQRIDRLKKLLEDAHQYLKKNAYKFPEEDYHFNLRAKRAKQDLDKFIKMQTEEPPSIIKDLKEQLRIDNEYNAAKH
ncbi:MAG: lysozyme inhibitor LprI family protein [Candidatus Sumerlaeia bacterium]